MLLIFVVISVLLHIIYAENIVIEKPSLAALPLPTELTNGLSPNELLDPPTALPTPGGRLGEDWFYRTSFYLFLNWQNKTILFDDKVLTNAVIEAVTNVYSSALSLVPSYGITVKASIYSQFSGGPETVRSTVSNGSHISTHFRLQTPADNLKYTIIFTVATYSSNSSAIESIDAFVSRQTQGPAISLQLASLGINALTSVQAKGAVFEIASNLPPPEPEKTSLIESIVIPIVLIVALIVMFILLWRRTVFRSWFLDGIDRLKDCCSRSADTVASVSEDAKRTLSRRMHRFQRAERDDTEYLALFENDANAGENEIESGAKDRNHRNLEGGDNDDDDDEEVETIEFRNNGIISAPFVQQHGEGGANEHQRPPTTTAGI